MPHYVDGFVLPLPKKKIAAYRTMAKVAAKVWMEHGALDYKECIGHDLKVKWGMSFPRGFKLKAGETVVFAWIVFKSKAHRDRINAKVMKDPRMNMVDPDNMPFDCNRMVWGGFEVLVSG